MHRRRFLALAAAGVAAGAAASFGSQAATAAEAPLDAAAFAAARRFVRTAFGHIAYVERGEGAAALFLHGFPLNGFQWRGALPRLARHRRCIAPDFLSLGHTEAAAGQDVGPQAQAAMLIALLDALKIGAVDLVANDSGSQVAQLLVARHPERVRTLLLTNGDTEIDSPPAALAPVIELSKAGRYCDEWLAPWRADTALARSPHGIGGMCYADPAHPTDEAIETYFAPILATPQRKALMHAYAIALEHNPLLGIQSALKRSTIPTRIVWGTADTIFSADSPDYLARSFGASRGVRRLQGARLFWPEERPDVIVEEARRLWGVAA
ncbi:alpha/beta hydrolase [Dokdonella sp.]|uniref:alpha/beta fold hydrolase n=1 Tax=Dokdonella sp. TaxID=2291710 RepID=UPI001B293006|nr:alpha/beta hydrolase [Dokdonella sp.]MBO9661759.1 alpha/beta hydrolase [Dokdonella sp.]